MCPPERRNVEPFSHPRVSRLPQPAAEGRVFQEACDRRSKARRISGRDQQPRLAVADGLGHAADAGGDDRQAGGHCLEDRERESFGPAGKDEEIRPREQFGNVKPRAGELDHLLETEAPNLRFDRRPIGPRADDDSLEAPRRQPRKRAHERQGILGRLETAHGHDPRGWTVAAPVRRGARVNTVVNDDGRLLVTRAGRDPGDALAVGDADGHRRQRPHEPVGPPVEAGGKSRMGRERPPVDGEDSDRHAGQPGGDAPEDSGLRAAGMEDVRTFPSQEHHELEQAQQVSPRVDRPPDVPERKEPDARGPRGVSQRPGPVRRDGDLEAPGERGEKRRDVRLRPSDLRERHEQKDAGPPCTHGGKRTNRFRALPFGVVGVGVFLWWAVADGGYAPTTWYPGALLFLVVVLALAVAPARRTPLSRRSAVAIAFLSAFAIWSFLSIGWAEVKGDAWDGANRTLMYASVFATFALPRWRPAQAAGLLALFAVGAAAIGLAVLVSDGTSAFAGDRLASPIEYANANAAFFLVAFWPALMLAARPEFHWLARGVLLAAAGVTLQLAILAQSRAALVAGFAALAVHLLLAPARLRALLTVLPVAAVTIASLGPLLDVYASSSNSELESAVARERLALAASAAVLLVAGVLLGALDRRRGDRRRALATRPRVLAVSGAVAGALLVALAAGAGIASVHEPWEVSSRFRDGLETGRYDIWRVAAGEFARHPFLGVGADNFAVDHVRERRRDEEPLYPHSVLLRAAAQTGLVGAALFLGFLAAAVGAALRARRQHDALAGAVASAGLVAAAYWLVHGSADWLWEIPAVTGPAVASLGLACGLTVDPVDRPSRMRRPRRVVVAGVVAAIAALAAVSYALPALSAFEVERAVRAWPEEPEQAFSRLDRARQLNVLSERPDVIAGVLARRGGRPARERRAFMRALERNRNDWYVHLRLALVAADLDRPGEALAHVRRARALNPREHAVDVVEAVVHAGTPAQRQLVDVLDGLAMRSPLGRRPVTCRPVLGMGARCPS
jgi:O-Antigen ligase